MVKVRMKQHDMNDIAIREATEADSASIAALMTSLVYERYAAFATRKLKELAAFESVRVYVAESEGEVVGLIGLDWQPLVHQASFNVAALAEGTYYLRLSTRFGTTTAAVKVIH